MELPVYLHQKCPNCDWSQHVWSRGPDEDGMLAARIPPAIQMMVDKCPWCETPILQYTEDNNRGF